MVTIASPMASSTKYGTTPPSLYAAIGVKT
jgi:hypothetical protein